MVDMGVLDVLFFGLSSKQKEIVLLTLTSVSHFLENGKFFFFFFFLFFQERGRKQLIEKYNLPSTLMQLLAIEDEEIVAECVAMLLKVSFHGNETFFSFFSYVFMKR